MKKINLLIIVLTLCSCATKKVQTQQKQINPMAEIYDAEYFKQHDDPEAGRYVVKYSPNGLVILMSAMLESGAWYYEYPYNISMVSMNDSIHLYKGIPYFKILTEFYPNGVIKRKGKYCTYLKIGIWRYYNEYGELIKEVDEDKKLKGNINKVFDFLCSKGMLNSMTGEGFERVEIREDGSANIINASFELFFMTKEDFKEFPGMPDYSVNYWVVAFQKKEDDRKTYNYTFHISNETGKILKTYKREFIPIV